MSSHWEVVGQLSNSHKAVIKKLLSGSYQGVVRQSGGIQQTVLGQLLPSCQEVTRQFSDNHQAAFRQSRGRMVYQFLSLFLHHPCQD